MLIFMAVGAVMGLPFQGYHHGPRAVYRTRITVVLSPDLLVFPERDNEWGERQSSSVEIVMETLSSPEIRRRASERLQKSNPGAVVPVHISANQGTIPGSIILTFKSTRLGIDSEFARTIIEEYIAFRRSVASHTGVTAEKLGEGTHIVEEVGDSVSEWPRIDPAGTVLGAILGFVCFVLFQWWRGDY
jgi:hypothetical protein